MKITVLYFARLREVFGLSSETLTLPDGASVNALLEILRQRGEVWAENLAANRAFRVAVNQDVVTGDALLSEGAEVAVFPPVLIIEYTEFDFVIDHAIFINASPMIFIVVDYYGARFVSFVIGCPESDFVID